VQLVAKRWSEPQVLALAAEVAKISGPFRPPPRFG
jgi:Asp-tRNA(Asn)/Glu-tRNA(Gln) amidotransferase A subunit family amidase